ncbi:MAG: winged helix-turn-helix transcriptional regulator [Chloroflexi bacterium]|nr:winged helix-turn-helix transcriptional regulator [Chloroflexota bacterium]
MAKYSHLEQDELDRTFHALSHRTRREILARLSRGEASVTELARPFQASLATVSRHIEVLEKAGLASRTVGGRVHTLALRADNLHSAADWVTYYRRFWNEGLARLDEVLAEEEPDAAGT